MSEDHYSKALDHIHAVHAARECLREMYRDRTRDPQDVARLNHDLGDALKLADVHATLAVVEAIDNLVDALDERLAPRVVEQLLPSYGGGHVPA